MLLLSNLDTSIALESFVIGVELTDAEQEQIFTALTGVNPSKADIQAAIRRIISERVQSGKKEAPVVRMRCYGLAFQRRVLANGRDRAWRSVAGYRA